MYDIIISNAHVFNSDSEFCGHLAVIGQRVKKIFSHKEEKLPKAKCIIDASGKYVFPSFIDPHVHFHLPTPAGFSSDDFNTGTKAALKGGTTTVIDFVTPSKGESLIEALDKREAEAQSSNCNYQLHLSPIDFNDRTEAEIKACIDRGIKSFKVYMAYKDSIGLQDDELRKVMQAVAKYDKLLVVHAEDGDRIDELRNQYADSGKTTPKFHPLSRPPKTEANAVKKVINMARETGCRLYIVHVSAAESLKYIREAKAEGLPVFAETCPHYLLLDDSRYEGDFGTTSGFVLSPPLRPKGNELELWNALTDGTFDTIATDHCPFSKAQKMKGLHDFRKIPNGAGGTEHRPALIYTKGVLKNRMDLKQFVALNSTNAAKIFGLYPQKGQIAEGSDADLVIWNPKKQAVISAATHSQNTDINIYEGFETQGYAETVILGGKIVTTQS